MRFQLLFLVLIGLSSCAFAQSWSVSAQAGLHTAHGVNEALSVNGEGMVTQVEVWRRVGNGRFDIGLTLGHFRLYGLTRFGNFIELQWCITRCVNSNLPVEQPLPLMSFFGLNPESYWTALPALRYWWLDRKIYSRLTLAAGVVYQAPFSRTLYLPTSIPTPLETAGRAATLSPSIRGELTLGIKLDSRFRIGIYGGYDRTRLGLARTSRNLRGSGEFVIAGDVPFQQLRAGIAVEVAL